MSTRKNLCVLVTEVLRSERLVQALGTEEAHRAVERCIHRIDRVIDANGGQVLGRTHNSVDIAFERCDSAVLAACEMLERVLNLPPVAGTHLSVRIGMHYGPVDSGPVPGGEGIELARRLADAAKGDQALASGAAVMLLTAATRHFAGTEETPPKEIEGIEWPIYALGNHLGQVTTVPPATRVSQRLRIRHQQEVLFVEEQRPVILFGRELGNDVVVIDARASRQHARLERRREGFVLVDRSTNGTFVKEEGGEERCIRHGEILLVGPGRIGCGFSANEVERDLVFFEVV